MRILRKLTEILLGRLAVGRNLAALSAIRAQGADRYIKHFSGLLFELDR